STGMRLTRKPDLGYPADALLLPIQQRASETGVDAAAVAQHPHPALGRTRGECRSALVVRANHQCTPWAQPGDEVVEHRRVRLGGAEEVEVVGLDVGHH